MEVNERRKERTVEVDERNVEVERRKERNLEVNERRKERNLEVNERKQKRERKRREMRPVNTCSPVRMACLQSTSILSEYQKATL